MSPIAWALRPLHRYADFSGRASRPEFWWYFLAYVILSVIVMIVEDALGISKMVGGMYGPLTLLLTFGLFVPSLAVGARRLHDTDRTGWWQAAPLVVLFLSGILAGIAMASQRHTGEPNLAFAGAGGLLMILGAVLGIVLLVFWILSGTPGDNRFGPPPAAN